MTRPLLPLPAAWVEPMAMHLTACSATAMSPASIDMRRLYLTRLAQVSADPWQVSTDQLRAFVANPEWSAQTQRHARSQLRGFYRWATLMGFTEASPAAELDPVLVPRSLPRPAPVEVVEQGLSGADERVRLMLLLGAHAGLRRAEIAALRRSDITDAEIVVRGKGGNQRVVPLDPDGDLAAALRAELKRQPRSVWLFPGRDQSRHLQPIRVGNLIAAALPEDNTAHHLRHRFATSAYAATKDLRAVQDLLGHTKPETTAVYAAVPDGALLAAVTGAGLGNCYSAEGITGDSTAGGVTSSPGPAGGVDGATT